MPNLTQEQVTNLTAEDMRNHMYGEIQSMIEGNAPENIAFHYFMPPIPFGPELASFMDIGFKAKEWKDTGFTNNDLMRAAVNFAAIVDNVPEISKSKEGQVIDLNTLISSGVTVSNVYDSILKNCRVFNNSRSEEDEEELEKLRALLYKIPKVKKADAVSESSSSKHHSLEDTLSSSEDKTVNLDKIFAEDAFTSTKSIILDPDSISDPTTATILYDALKLNYETVVLTVLDQLKNISPNDPNAGLRKKILLGKIKSAKQRWEVQGKKTQVESIKARILQMSQGGMPEYLSELRDRFEGSEMLASIFMDEKAGPSLSSESAYYTALRPNGILSAAGLIKINISSSSINSESKFKNSSTSAGVAIPFSFGLLVDGKITKANTINETEFYKNNFEISFQIVQGLIDRPWFEKAFIESRAYTTVDPRTRQPLDPVAQITKLSDGKIPPQEGIVKAIPMTVYFIKDLKVRSKVFKSLSGTDQDSLSGKAGVSIFGFGVNAGHENTTINTNFLEAENMGEISADGIYLIGMSSVYLKNSPNPDFDSFPSEQWI